MAAISNQIERLRIGIYGASNSGKSTLLNAITGQQTSLVSAEKGTTTDPVRKVMEIPSLGPILWIDTPGFDDPSILGQEREQLAEASLKEVDLALILLSQNEEDDRWIELLKAKKVPFIPLLPKRDQKQYDESTILAVEKQAEIRPIPFSSRIPQDVDRIIETIDHFFQEKRSQERTITGDLCKAGDLVVLVMPQDASAPKGRLILPQVQTIRELLDKQCTPVCTTPETFLPTLASFAKKPDIIITDSQCFRYVYDHTPKDIPLTSFSILFAALKGDVQEFLDGAKKLSLLSSNARILIAEACTHAPQNEDIGRVKLPMMLRKRWGNDLQIEIRSGKEFPDDLTPYDIIIHCGACMFNRTLVMNRVKLAQAQNVAITNYGMAIAYLTDILDKVVLPTSE